MAKIDPGLKFLAEQDPAVLRGLAEESIFEVSADPAPKATVLAQFSGDIDELEAAGFETRNVVGDVATGQIALADLGELEALGSLVRIEASRALYSDLDLALPETRGDVVHAGPPARLGAGVIVGIVDSGIDYTHQAFRRPDGSSRILAIWDQGLDPQGSESSPAGFGYGVEYRTSDVDAALGGADPFSVVRHQDLQIPGDGFHGTHVAGIAAGDGSVAGQGSPAFTFVGLAPEADVVVVANTRGRAAGERGLGDSADTLDAIRYIFDVAAAVNRPAVINQSQGDNVGPHDGTGLLEIGIDNLLATPGRAMVKSAGNEGAANRHASGAMTDGGTQNVQFTVPPNRAAPITLDLWYDGSDRFDFAITPPAGAPSAPVAPGTTTTIKLTNGNEVFVDSDLNDPGSNDNRIFAVISRTNASSVQAGTWSFALTGTIVTSGEWNAWFQRGAVSPQFLPPFVDRERTISVPGTSRQVITAGSYITRNGGVGGISSFSSLGPTRDGRQAPTIAAPGQVIMAPQPAATGDTYGLMQGTSMAAPMVSGAVVLVLEKNPGLTQDQIRTCLDSSARSDASTTPSTAWGAGKLDAAAAVAAAPPP
jgi:subtilisin family serine protease